MVARGRLPPQPLVQGFNYQKQMLGPNTSKKESSGKLDYTFSWDLESEGCVPKQPDISSTSN